MFLSRLVSLILLATGSMANAGVLSDMGGAWRGSGWAKETPQGPQETVRCQITNTYDDVSDTLTLVGQCVVPGRRFTMSGTLTVTEGSERITGSWSNPDGIGSARVVGVQQDGIVAFNFSALDPATGRNVAQNVELRVSDEASRLRSTDRQNPDIMMSDISFSR